MGKVKYALTNQGYGSLVNADKVLVNRELIFEVDAEGETVKLVSKASGSPFYERVVNGVCKFPKSVLVGDIGISIITKQGAIPCTSLIALKTTEGTVVLPDARDVFTRFERAERDISDAILIHRELEDKYKGLEDKLKRLFDGYNF